MGLPIELNGKKIKPQELTYNKVGKKILFVFDTYSYRKINLLVENSNYLIMEVTFIYKLHTSKTEEFNPRSTNRHPKLQ